MSHYKNISEEDFETLKKRYALLLKKENNKYNEIEDIVEYFEGITTSNGDIEGKLGLIWTSSNPSLASSIVLPSHSRLIII